MSQLQMFGANMYVLIGLLFSCCCFIILVIGAIVGMKVAWWEGRKWLARRAIYGRKFDERGQPLPRAYRGACTRCGHLFNVVYDVDEHRQLCTRCYGIERELNERKKTAAEQEAQANESTDTEASRETPESGRRRVADPARRSDR